MEDGQPQDAVAQGTPPGAMSPRWGRIGVAVLLLVLLLAGAVYGYTVVRERLESARQIDEATALLKSADATVMGVDGVIQAEITSEVATQAAGLIDDLDATQETLLQAAALIDDARPGLNDEDRERAQVLKDVAGARDRMLEEARPILEANALAAAALPLVRAGWELVLSADEEADQAIDRYNTLTKDGVTASSKLNAEAQADLEGARERFDAAKKAYPALDLAAYAAYVEAKLGLVALSRQSDAAWLAGDPVKANSLASTYNETEKKVVELAKKLPASPEDVVADAYETDVGADVERYFDARERAEEADEELRRF